MEGRRLQAVQLCGPGRAIEHAAGNVPIPGAQLRRIQGQVEAFLAVFEGLFGSFAFAGIEKGAEQVGLAFQFDFLRAENAVVDLAVAGAELDFEAGGLALFLHGLDQLRALFGINPQADLQGSAAYHMFGGPAELAFEVLVGLADQAIFQAGQQHHVGAQVKQGGETFFRAAEGFLPLALVGDLADHPDHSGLAMLVR